MLHLSRRFSCKRVIVMLSRKIRKKVLDIQNQEKGATQGATKLRNQVAEALKHEEAQQRKIFVEQLNQRLLQEQTIFENIRTRDNQHGNGDDKQKQPMSLNQRFNEKYSEELSPTQLMNQHTQCESAFFKKANSSSKRFAKKGNSGLFQNRSLSQDDAEDTLQKNLKSTYRKSFPI